MPLDLERVLQITKPMMPVTCPTCFQEVLTENVFDDMVVCHCGQVIQVNTSQNKTERNWTVNGLLVLFTTLLIGAFIHAINWDGYFFEIIPLKGKQILGVANPEDLSRLNDICRERKKYFCQEQVLTALWTLRPTDAAVPQELAQLQILRSAHAEAVVTLQKYIAINKTDRKARYQLADSLAHLGRVREAKQNLHYLVFSKTKDLDPAPARLYVSLLIQEKNFKTARRVIEHCRKLGPNAAMFLEKEWRLIQEQTNSLKRRRA